MWWVIEGASASISGTHETLAAVRRASSYHGRIPNEMIAREIPFDSSRKVAEFIADKIGESFCFGDDDGLQEIYPLHGFVGKSLGAVKLVRAFSRLRKRKTWWRSNWREYDRSKVILIDPHSPFLYNEDRPLRGELMPLDTTCLYQREHCPMGAELTSRLSIRVLGCDHMTIAKASGVRTTIRMYENER